jgi:hypothetical protein
MVPKECCTIWSSDWKPCAMPLLGDLHQPGFGVAEDVKGRFTLVGGARNGHGTDAHELAQQALVLDDADVLFDDRPARQPFSEPAR